MGFTHTLVDVPSQLGAGSTKAGKRLLDQRDGLECMMWVGHALLRRLGFPRGFSHVTGDWVFLDELLFFWVTGAKTFHNKLRFQLCVQCFSGGSNGNMRTSGNVVT